MGAPTRRDGELRKNKTEINIDEGREFWSFQPLVKPEIPQLESDWAETEIDQFILARLQKEDLEPVEEASRRSLVRRASYALTGLPPSPEQIEQFVQDRVPRERGLRRADRQLVGIAHFGRQQGRHWLDVVRFAESSGGGRSRCLKMPGDFVTT
ncbi:MAG: DUF1549 domain-containing protein [Planctomycetaceae bacterium]